MTQTITLRGLAIAVLCAAPVTSALAGFEFIPPNRSSEAILNAAPSAPAAPAGMQMTPAPAASVVGEALSSAEAQTAPQSILPPAAPSVPQYALKAAPPSGGPVINMQPLAAQAPAAATPNSSQLEQAMLAGYTPAAPVGRSSIGGMPLPPAQSSGNYTEAVGFGRDLPLALAVSQIVPPDYAFSFDNNVNPGHNVSWEGGRAWDQVLNDTLAPLGASARIDDAKKEITIVSGGASATPVSMTAPAPAAPAPAAYAQVPRPPAGAAPMPMTSMTPPPSAQPAVQEIAPVMATPPAPVAAPKMQLAGLNKQTGVLDTAAVRTWEASRGTTLRTILTDWAMQAGVELFWSSDFDFPVESAIRIKGTFEEAVQTLLSGLRDAQPRPIGRLHPNLPDGPSVLVIETRHVIE